MKMFAIGCICLAAYLFQPLPQRRNFEAPDPDAHIEKPSEPKPASNSEIIQALEIIQLGLNSGMTISDALEFAKRRSSLSASNDLQLVLYQSRMGLPLARGLEDMAINNPRWRSISDTLIVSLNSGSPIIDQLADVEYVLQSQLDMERLKRIKSVAVKSVLPLGICFLPAFILLAIVPIIAGLITGMTG
jgi:pilus assembly protein TadC